MDRKFTPGPWTVQVSDSMFGCYYVDQICDKQALHPAEEVDAEDRANARLIAAAPDLLAALIRLEHVESGPHSEFTRYLAREDARAAITKATREGQ